MMLSHLTTDTEGRSPLRQDTADQHYRLRVPHLNTESQTYLRDARKRADARRKKAKDRRRQAKRDRTR